MKVKYIGKDLVAIRYGKIYEFISIEKGWYRIMTEIDEDYLFPPECFEIIISEEKNQNKFGMDIIEVKHGKTICQNENRIESQTKEIDKFRTMAFRCSQYGEVYY